MQFEFWLIYVTTVFCASIIPGPSMLLAMNHGMKYGAKRTMATALGNVSASLIQASISVAGLGAVLLASERAFLMIKWAGAAYLIILGINMFRSSGAGGIPERGQAMIPKIPLKNMFAQAFFVAAGNPKAIVFFSALFPQFIKPDMSFGPQFCVLMVPLAFIAFVCFMIYAIGGEKIVFILTKKQVLRLINKMTGGVFISAGIGLILSDR